MAPRRKNDEENASSDDENLSILSDTDKSDEDAGRRGCSQFQAKVCLVFINLLTLVLGVGLVYFGIVGKQAAKRAAGITTLVLPGASEPDHVGAQVVHRMGRQMGEFTSEFPAGSPPPNDNTTAPAPISEQRKFLARETWLALWVLGDPYNCLMGFGTGLVILSLVGLYSACTNDRQGLFLYYTGLMLMCGLLLYIGVYCLLFAENARSFELLYYKTRAPAELPNSKQAIEERAMAALVHALVWAGSLCVATSALLAGGLFASSAQMGHSYAAKRMSMAMNLVTVVLGGFLLYLAILTTQTNAGGEWAAIIVAAAGASTVLLSLVGYFGLSRHKWWMLLIHATLLCLITALMLAGGITCFVYKDRLQDQINSNWHLIQAKVTNMDQQKVLATLSSHLVMIGVFCLLLIACLLFNLCTSIHTLRTHWRHWDRIGGSTDDLRARPKYRKTQVVSEEEESDDDVMSTVTAGKPGKGVGSANAPAIELMERIKLKVSGQEHKHGMVEKLAAKETGKKNKIPARKDK